MLIRPLEPHDQSEWLRLRRALWPDCSEAMHAREMEEYADSAETRAVFVVVRGDGRLGGFAEVLAHDRVDGSLSPRVAYLEGWYVAPDCRRLGVGRELLAAAEPWARARGCREFSSDTHVENDVSRTAHRALGFKEGKPVVHFRRPI